jgi:23S rRNA G2445 N2-methylase RlmL
LKSATAARRGRKWTNGTINGLDASTWHLEGAASNLLQCQLAGCHEPATFAGNFKMAGWEAFDLVQLK